MRNTLIVFVLILLNTTTLLASGNSATEKYGPNKSSILLDKESNNLTLKKNDVSSSIRGTIWDSYPLYGGEMTSIAINPNNPQIVYVGTRDAGVYKTKDGGSSWSTSRIGLTFYPIRSLAIDPDNSGILYAGTDYNGIWKSIDSGATWFKSSNGLYEGLIIFNVIIDQQNPDILYAGLGGGIGLAVGNIYKSTDGGTNWVLSDDGLTPHSESYKNAIISLAIDPNNSSILYAGTNFDGAFMSSDTGKTWNAINDSLPVLSGDYYQTVNGLAAHPNNSGRVCAIIQGRYYIYNGSYWQLKCGDFINKSIECAYLYFYPTDTSIIYSSGNRFSKSIDSGENWENYLGWGGNTDCSNVPDIAFNSLTSDTIFAATDISGEFDGGVFKSTDQGENWNENSDGITATVISCVAIDPQNINRIYAGEGNGHFYRTEDGGTNWYHEYLNADEFTDIKIDPANSANIYLASLTGLYKSPDYGDNFDIISEVEHPQCIAINPLLTNTIYVGSSLHGIYKTTNGGTTWEQKNNGLPELMAGMFMPIISIAIDPNDTSVVWAGTEQEGILKSLNGGNEWINKGLNNENYVNCITINPNNSNEILVGTGYIGYANGSIYKSINGGESWVKKDSLIAFVYDIKYDPRDPQFVYAATEGYGVLRSTNGGETWHDYSNGIFYPVLYSLDISQNDSVLLIAGTYGSGLYYIHPELSGIEEQKVEDKPTFFRESSLEISGTFNLIQFNLPKAGIISLKLYDIMGREVTEILNEHRPAGRNEISWNTEKIPAGIYFYHLEFEGTTESSKTAFIK